jgi:hypothetical protein
LFSWPAVPNAIYALDLQPSRIVTPYHPHVTVYTADASATWPDTSVLQIGFPTSAATYKVRAIARGAYRSMDDATGPQGIAAAVPQHLWISSPNDARFDIMPPGMGPPDPACHFEYGSVILCGDPRPGDVEGVREHYMLAPINNSLHYYPELAKLVGFSCVRDCASARIWAKAHDEYSKTHPGFDANAPMDDFVSGRSRPPPPPPPGPPPPARKPRPKP